MHIPTYILRIQLLSLQFVWEFLYWKIFLLHSINIFLFFVFVVSAMSGNCIKLYDKLYVMLATLCIEVWHQLRPYLASRHSSARSHGQQADSRDLILTNKRDHLYIPSLIILTLHYACSFTVMNITMDIWAN